MEAPTPCIEGWRGSLDMSGGNSGQTEMDIDTLGSPKTGTQAEVNLPEKGVVKKNVITPQEGKPC